MAPPVRCVSNVLSLPEVPNTRSQKRTHGVRSGYWHKADQGNGARRHQLLTLRGPQPFPSMGRMQSPHERSIGNHRKSLPGAGGWAAVFDLRNCLARGDAVAEIAAFLMRTEDAFREKARPRSGSVIGRVDRGGLSASPRERILSPIGSPSTRPLLTAPRRVRVLWRRQ